MLPLRGLRPKQVAPPAVHPLKTDMVLPHPGAILCIGKDHWPLETAAQKHHSAPRAWAESSCAAVASVEPIDAHASAASESLLKLEKTGQRKALHKNTMSKRSGGARPVQRGGGGTRDGGWGAGCAGVGAGAGAVPRCVRVVLTDKPFQASCSS